MILKSLLLFFVASSKCRLSEPLERNLDRGIRRRCDPPVDETLYEHAHILKKGTYLNSTNCYFLVKRASFMVFFKNETLPKDKDDRYDLYQVDLKKGRDICAAHQASLPIIQTEGEQKFLVEQYAKVVSWILLGMQRTCKGYVWDNKDDLSFKPKQWHKINETATGTYNLLMTQHHTGRWWEFFPNHTWPKKERFGVICQQMAFGPNGDLYSDTHPRGGVEEETAHAPLLEQPCSASREKIDIAKPILMLITILIIF